MSWWWIAATVFGSLSAGLVILVTICACIVSSRAAAVEAERQRCAACVAAESGYDAEAFDRVERQILSGEHP